MPATLQVNESPEEIRNIFNSTSTEMDSNLKPAGWISSYGQNRMLTLTSPSPIFVSPIKTEEYHIPVYLTVNIQ